MVNIWIQQFKVKLSDLIPRWLFWVSAVLLVGIFNEFARTGLPEAKRGGNHADLAVMLFMLSAIFIFHLGPKWVNRTLTSIVMLVLTVFTILNWWFYDFYRDYLTPSAMKLAIYAEESAMAWDGLAYRYEALWFLLSIATACLVLFSLHRFKPSRKALFLTAVVVFSLACYKQYQASTRALGGLKHKGSNHIAYFIKHFAPAEKFSFDQRNMEQIEALFPYKQFTGGIEYPLYQYVEASSKPDNPLNVIVIVLESVRMAETGLKNGNNSITPNLDKIGESAVVAQNAYTNANQTARSELAILCSSLDYIKGAPYAHLSIPINTACLPGILSDYGYETFWIHGYKKSFYNRDKFYPTLGFKHLLSRDEMIEQGYTDMLGWGITDEALFEYTLAELEKQQKPFFAEVLTLSNHYPYLWDWGIDFPGHLQLPDDFEDSTEVAYPAYRRGVYYTDYQLGKFWEAFKESPLFDNTLVVITGDHGIWTFPQNLKANESFGAELHKNEVYFRMPLIFHAPGLEPSRLLNTVSHADIAPSVLDFLGIRYPNAFLGSSVFKRQDEVRPVYFLASGGYGVRKNNLYCYPIDTSGLCETYNRKCESYQLQETEIQCVTSDRDLIDGIQPFDLIDYDLSNDDLLIQLTQHALNSRHMPGGAEMR